MADLQSAKGSERRWTCRENPVLLSLCVMAKTEETHLRQRVTAAVVPAAFCRSRPAAARARPRTTAGRPLQKGRRRRASQSCG